jgi:hypothetical protein
MPQIVQIVWLPSSSRKSSKVRNNFQTTYLNELFFASFFVFGCVKLVTTGTDGKVLVWTLVQKLDQTWFLQLLQG